MKWFSKLSLLSIMLVTIISLVAGCGGDSGKKFLNIATGGTAGTYYPIGGAMAEILNNEIKGMNASAQSTGATVANINMLKDGQVDLAIVQNDITYYAANGTEMFDGKKVSNIRGIASLYPETCQIVTLEGKGINSVADLRGKRVAVGAMGSGAEANARQILAAYGITYEDNIDAQFLSFGEAASALKDGNIDAAFLTAGYPTAAVQDIASQNKVKLVPIDADKADNLIAKYPFYTKVTIPAGTYGMPAAVDTISVMAMLVCNDKVDDALGYEITKALFTHLDRIQAAHAAAKAISKEGASKGMPIPMNAGAEKFFKE